jgi:dTDP-4-dehydrorhamnose reductase
VYASTKAAAEDLVHGYQQGLVARLPLMLGRSPSGSRSVDEALLGALQRGERPALFVDEYRTPIHARLAADAIWRLLELEIRGIVHVAGSTRLSRWQMGTAIAARLGLPAGTIFRGRLADFRGTPPRCPDVSLQTAKLHAITGKTAPTFEQSLALPLAAG